MICGPIRAELLVAYPFRIGLPIRLQPSRGTTFKARECAPRSRVRSVGKLSDPLRGRGMQALAWFPVNVQDIDLAARLRSNGRSRIRRSRATSWSGTSIVVRQNVKLTDESAHRSLPRWVPRV